MENIANKIIINKNSKTHCVCHSVSFILSFILIVYMVTYFYLYPFVDNADGILNYSFIVVSLLIFCYLSYKLFYKDNMIEKKYKRLFLTFIVFIAISFCVTKSGFEKILGLCIILLSFLSFRIYPMNLKERRIIYYAFLIAVVVLLLNTSKEVIPDSNKFNPNSGGFLLSMLFCVSLVRFIMEKSTVSFVTVVLSFALQFIFSSRTAMFGCLLFLFLFIICRSWRKTFNRKTVFYTIFIFSVLGILAAYVYAEVLYPVIGHGKIFIFGKDLFTGRQTIWDFTFQSIRENFIFGVGSHLNEEKIAEGYYNLIINAHNQPLGMLAAFGILPFVSFYVLFSLFTAYFYKRNSNLNKATRTPAIFVLTIILMSWLDLYFFSQYNWLAIIITLGLISSYSIKEVHTK